MENPKHNPRMLDFYEMTGWFEYFRSSAAAAGGCDILCAGRLLHWKAAIGFVAATFAAADETGNPRFEKILTILTGDPSGFENQTRLKKQFLTEVLDCVTNGYAALDIQIDRTSVEQSLGRIDIVIADQHQLSTLVEVIDSCPPSSAIFIGKAELFSASVSRNNSDTQFENVGLRLEEDFWVQDVYHTAKVLAEIAERRQLYILLFVQRFGPVRRKNNELLKSIENVAFSTVNVSDEEVKDDEILIKNAIRWRQLAKEQKLDEVMSEIDREPLTPINRALLKAQYLMTADQPLLGFTAVQPFLDAIRENSTVHLKLTVAQIANRAGRYTTSLELLRRAIQSSSCTEYELSNALDLAHSLGANDEIKIIVERLIGSYPGSTTTAYERLRLCKDPGQFAQLAKDLLPLTEVADRSEDIYFVYLLASKFGVQEIPDYRQVVEEITLVAPTFRSSAILACAARALKQRLFYTVIDLTLNEDWPINNREAVARHLISVLEGIFVSKSVAGAENVSQNKEAVQRCLIFILKYLGANPLDGDIRAALYRILSPETSGMNGMAHLAHIIIDAPAHTILSDNPRPAIPDLLTPDQLEHSFETAASKLSQPIILGTGRFPGVKPDISLDSFLQSIMVLLQSASINKIVDEHDVHFVHLLLHLAILASRDAQKEEEYGPKAMRIAAAGLAASGYYQPARNFAELCLQLASESSDYHKRASWLAYADIYSRCYNLVDALIGMAIAVNIGVDSDTPDSRYDYLIVTCRIVRDLNYFHSRCALYARHEN
jgi:tetratricopeptide (TPR) repeat protein